MCVEAYASRFLARHGDRLSRAYQDAVAGRDPGHPGPGPGPGTGGADSDRRSPQRRAASAAAASPRAASVAAAGLSGAGAAGAAATRGGAEAGTSAAAPHKGGGGGGGELTAEVTAEAEAEAEAEAAQGGGLRLGVATSDHLLSPVCAPCELLRRFPACAIMASELDPLLDDAVMFTARLRALGPGRRNCALLSVPEPETRNPKP